MNSSFLNPRQRIALMCGALAAIGMLAVPPWRDLKIPPFGSGESFGGYSPIFWPPHHPWTFPALAEGEFWNSQHEYRINWIMLAVQIAVVGLLTVAAIIALRRSSREERPSDKPELSVAAAFLGGVGALVVGLLGVMAVMAPLLELAPEARLVSTALLLIGYLSAIVVAAFASASIGSAPVGKFLAGVGAGQLVAAYVVFAFLPDASPVSHRILLGVWLIATSAGATAGAMWAKSEWRGRGAVISDPCGD
jgi:hypothetical protein